MPLQEKPLSELTDVEKQQLTAYYLKELSDIYLAKHFKLMDSNPGPIEKSFADHLSAREQEVLALSTWVNGVIQQYINKKQSDLMNQAAVGQSPPESYEFLLKRAAGILDELRKRWSRTPPSRLEHLPMVEAALGLVSHLSTNFYTKVSSQ